MLLARLNTTNKVHIARVLIITTELITSIFQFIFLTLFQISRRMRTVTNMFIANLALADFIIGLFTIPFQFQAALLQRWNLPHIMCAVCPFVQVRRYMSIIAVYCL